MTFLQAIILGIVEGITEFLPISSTGHLILASDVLGIPVSDFLKTFEVSIQLGAICSVAFLYWRRIIAGKDLWLKLLVAFLPSAVIGVIAYPLVKSMLGNQQVVLWSLFLGGVVIYGFEKYFKHPAQTNGLDEITYKQALGVGLAQSVAIIPGVSRAAATILGGLAAGLDRKSIVEFSFLLAIPTMAAATGLDLFQTSAAFTSQEWSALGVGFGVSFAVALLAVRWLLKYVQTHDFSAFGIYRIALAVIFWVWFT